MIRNAAIMAGGQSRRFNSDKTLEVIGGHRLIEYPAMELGKWADRLVVVAKDCGKYSFLDLPCVQDEQEQQCPMIGILTALKHFGEEVFVVAADTPLVNSAHAEKLLAACKGHDAAVPVIYGKTHPLYACYAPSMIPVFEKQVAAGNFRLMDAFALSDVVYLDEGQTLASENEKISFININTKDDLTAAQDYLKGE
ncbi:molybdenum cofactor guanylyltransferase [Seleniivibrio woodruffii]|uniref:molybdenum cofactor guanylyltransferase n=1 Tax=Seleniivibrio woodruffii TaxID=1078050 RepID=UPI0039E59097